MNAIKTTFLLALLTGILIIAGQLIGGRDGAIFALVVAGVMNIGAYWFSDRLVLARYRGQEVDATSEPRLARIVQRLADRTGMPMPRMFLIPSDSLNAFATGRDPAHAAVAATRGLLDNMDDDEIEAVMAHEISHVRHRDTLIGSVAATLAGAIMLLASMARFAAIFRGYGGDRRDGGNLLSLLAMAIVAPIAAMLVQMAVSRTCEFAADRGSAEITGRPLDLARALRKLEAMSERRPLPATESTAHLFIVNPLRGGRTLARLFSTHPPTEERIARLEAMAAAGQV